jgi:paraquat-inducible protein A
VIACPDCGTLTQLPALAPGLRASCRTCRADLERTNGRSITAALGCAAGSLILLVPANLLLMMDFAIFGLHRQGRLATGVPMLWERHWLLLSVSVAMLAVVLPIVRGALLCAVLACLRMGRRARWLGPVFRTALELDIWAMPDVFLLAAFVGYYRLINVSHAQVTIGAGGFCLIAAALLAMISRAALDARAVWRMILPESADCPTPALSCTVCELVMPLSRAGSPCPRCGARLHARKPYSLMQTTALGIAALLLLFPAYDLPMNVTVQLGSEVDRTIFQGVRDLFNAHLPSLGVLIFFTSIAIPVLKLAGLGWLVVSVRRRSRRWLVLKTRLYRFIAEMGRWSNVDPFAIAVFVPLMTLRPFASSNAGWGATAFIAVVVLTLLASRAFDPRLLWDAAEASS